MRLRVGAAVAIAFLLVTRSGRAEESRVRFGASFVSGVIDAPFRPIPPETSNVYMAEPTVVGAALRFGVQVNDHFAFFYQTSGTLWWFQWRNAIFVEWTPVDHFSVGLGPSVDLLSDVSTSSWSIGGSLRLAVHVPFRRKPSGRRDAWTIGVDVTPSYAFGLSPGLTDGFQLGVIGHTGIELY